MKDIITDIIIPMATTYKDFQEYQLETLIKVVQEAKKLGIVKGFEYEKEDFVFGMRKFKIKNMPDDFGVHCNAFMIAGAIEIKDGENTIWEHDKGWVFDRKWVALNRLKKIDG